MRRLLWVGLAVGVGSMVGVLVVHRAGGVGRLRELAGVVREGMAEREAELRFALGIDTRTLPGTRGLGADGVRAMLDDPAGPRAR